MRRAQMWQVTWLHGAMAWCWMGLAQMKQTSSAPASSSASPVSGFGLGCRRACFAVASSFGPSFASVAEASAVLGPRPLARFPPRPELWPSPLPLPRPPLFPRPLPRCRLELSPAGPLGAAEPVSAMATAVVLDSLSSRRYKVVAVKYYRKTSG